MLVHDAILAVASLLNRLRDISDRLSAFSPRLGKKVHVISLCRKEEALAVT